MLPQQLRHLDLTNISHSIKTGRKSTQPHGLCRLCSQRGPLRDRHRKLPCKKHQSCDISAMWRSVSFKAHVLENQISIRGLSITAAVSSYLSVTGKAIYSAGGHTAELHHLGGDGSFGPRIQELQYLSNAEMETADRTRKALVGSNPLLA